MHANERHFEGRHARTCIGRFLRIEIAAGDMAGRVGRLNYGERFKIGREQRVEVFVHPGRVGKDRVAAAVGQLMSKQRGEGWCVGAETAIGMPDMIAQILSFIESIMVAFGFSGARGVCGPA